MKIYLGLLVLVVVSVLAVLYFNLAQINSTKKIPRPPTTLSLPKGGETKMEMIVIEDGEVIGTAEEVEQRQAGKVGATRVETGASPLAATEKQLEPSKQMETKEIMITDGVRHSIPLEEINTLLSADGIPSIDNPTFVSMSEADKFLNDSEPGIAFSRNNTQRFYPYQILTWHEIVNDTVEGERVLITYCPLCLTGYALDPLVKGERAEFGTSGKLWKSNLIMYDRKTNSLWSQVLAEAIVGEMTGTRLKLLPSDQMRYGEWKKTHPKGKVLSRDTGFLRRYGSYPYAEGNYFGVDGLSLRLVNPTDTRLPNDAFVFGVVVNGKAKAYEVETIKNKNEVQDVFEGETFLLKHDKELDVVRMFRRLPDSTWERVSPISGFWFSWTAAHPDTELYK